MKPDIHGVRTRWIRGSMAFQLARRRPMSRRAGVLAGLLGHALVQALTQALDPGAQQVARL
jgi:hypothetical protein